MAPLAPCTAPASRSCCACWWAWRARCSTPRVAPPAATAASGARLLPTRGTADAPPPPPPPPPPPSRPAAPLMPPPPPPPPLLDGLDFAALAEALAALGADAWLLYDFRHVNPVAERILGPTGMGTRRLFVLLPRSGKPVAVAHRIELQPLAAFPGEVRAYGSWRELHSELRALERRGGGRAPARGACAGRDRARCPHLGGTGDGARRRSARGHAAATRGRGDRARRARDRPPADRSVRSQLRDAALRAARRGGSAAAGGPGVAARPVGRPLARVRVRRPDVDGLRGARARRGGPQGLGYGAGGA